MPRINLASNTNRSLLKVAMASDSADLKQLTQLAKDKLRLKGIKGFYMASGQELLPGVPLQEDAVILVHRGEAFVGKASAPSAASSAEPRPLPACVDSAFPRSWLQSASTEAAGQPQLRVMSFNILAPCLAQGTESGEGKDAGERGARSWGVYPTKKLQHTSQPLTHNFDCDPAALAWEHRFPRLRHELVQHRPDVLCLQEMDSTAWGDVQSALQQEGYCEGVCAKAKGGANNFVAMFWREDQLRAVGEPEIVYLKAQGTITAIIQRLRFLPRGDVPGGDAHGKSPSDECVEEPDFVVVTTHLKAGIKLKDEQDRTKQAEDLLAVLNNIVRQEDSIIFTGDFNAHVEDLPFSQPSAGGLSKLPGLVVPRVLRAGFRCAVREATGGTPLSFSQWCWRCDVEIKSVIDHIFLRGPHVAASAALAAPSEAEVIAAGGLPNERHPSDHIPVIVDLFFHGLDSRPRLEPPATCQAEATCPVSLPVGSAASAPQISEKELLCMGQDLPQSGRVALTEDGFKYVLLGKEWQTSRYELVDAAASFYSGNARDVVDADKVALQRNLTKQQGLSAIQCSWGFWTPPSSVGIHISLGKHADSVGVGRRVRFQVKKLLNFQTRKLGSPSSSPEGQSLFCARWFTFEVTLVDEARCDGEEPHISFAVFGARQLDGQQP